MYDPKLTKPPQDFSKGIPKATDQEIDLDTWDDMVADKFKVPKSLMKAVRGQESGGDINAKSPTGVRGRYQVTKATARSYGLDRDDPWQQSIAAAKHLRKLFDETDGADDDEKWLGAVGKYYGGNNAVRNGEIVGSSIDGVSNPAKHVRRVARKWGKIRRSERSAQPQGQPQQPAPRGVSSADIIPPEQRLTIPEGQSLNIGTGQIGKRAPVQGAAARRPNEAVEGAQRALSPLIPDEIEQEARQITNRATISDETRGYRRTPPPMVPSASALNQHMPFKQRPRNDVRDVPMTASEQRANQAGQLIRQIEAKRDQATALFQQADRAPAVRGDGRTLTAQDELRAQAEGELEAANRLGERVAQEFGDLVEVGFGADANRGSNRRWVYAKPKEGLTSFYTSRNAGQRAATSSREDIAREVAQQQQMRQRRNPARNSGVLGSAAYFFPEVVGEGLTGLTNTAMKGVANLGAGAVRLGERAAEKTLTGGPLSGALDLLPDSMAGPYRDYRKAVQDRVQAFGQSRQATKGAQTIGRAADTLAPISNEPTTYDPRKAEFYSRTLPQAAGSLVPLVGASLVTGGAAAAPFLAGAAMNAEQTYQETMARTGNEQLARQAADTGAAIGALEGFGLGRVLNKFGIKQALAKRALQVVEEAGQEGASQWLNNVNMRLRQIDPNRSLSPLDEEVLGNALLGAIMGGAAQVGGRMISGPETAQGKILREGGQPVSRDAAAQEPFAPTVRRPSPQETADADIRGIVQNYVAEMSALEKQPRTPERDAQMAQMREDYRALRNYIRDPQSLSDEQLQAILGRQQAAPEVTAEPMAQEAVAPNAENAPTAEVAPVEPVTPRPSGYVDVARTAQAEAADAERAGNWEAAVTRYAEQHEALKQYQRELRKTGTPEQKAEIARQISAADLSRRRASREVLRQERIANAPTKGLPRERTATPKAAGVAPTGGLLSSTVNPEGGVPKLPTQEVDFTRLAAEQSAQKPPKPAKRLLSRIAELGGIDERYAGELQDAADARRIGVIRKRAQMSPDIMARQLASEGYDVDPEDLNTLWEAARRDIVQGERPVNTAELTRRGEGTAELERRLAEEESAYNERQEQVSPSASQSLTWTGEKSHRKKNEDGDLVDVPFKQNEGAWRVKDDLGGEAYGNIVDGVASIIGMESVPPSKRYTNEAPGLKRRGFFRSLIKTLQANGARSIEINMQSADTQAAVRRLLQTGELINPREMRGSSLNEHPTLFDIPVGERQPFDEIVAEADAAFQPDTADLRQVREFGREPVEPGFTQEPPTAPLRTQGLRQSETARPVPQTDIERRAFLRQATPKGEYGKLSEYSRLRATENRSLSGSDELRKLLDLPEMPPYRSEQSGKTTEWSNAAQQTMDALAELAGFNKKRSSEMGLEGLRDAWRTLTKRAKERGTPVSDDLRDRFIHTAQSYQIGFLEPYMALHTSNETVSRALREIEDIYAKDGTLTIADSKRLYNTLRDEFVKAGLTEHYFRKTYWPAIKQAAGIATSGTGTRRAEGTGRDVQVETPRGAARQQAPATQESGPIKSGDRVQWEQRGRTETAFVSRIKGETAYVDYGTGDEVAVPVKRLRKAEVSPADAVRQIKPNGGLVPMVQLKRALGADADATILAAAERGEIALHRHNQPSAMTAEEKANAVHDAAQGDRGWYIGASVREGATFRQQEPPLKAQTRTRADVESSPAFRQWFGESKVVGEDGKPMVVYHGTFGDFDTFEQTKDIGYHFGTAKAARDRLRGLGKKMASGTRPASGAASTGAYYLSIQNPLEIRDTTGDSWQFLFADLKEKGVLNDEDWRYYNGIANKAMDQALIETEGQSDDAQAEAIQRAAVESSQEIYEDMRQMVLDAGYDGFKYTNRIEGKGSTSWIALKPEQIKSATGNRGTFSAESPSILQQKMPGFYSQLTRVIDQKMPAKASAAQVRAIIENPQSGVKPDEIKWTGLDDFLRDKETVTKAEVQEFLKASQVEVREVVRGDDDARDAQRKRLNELAALGSDRSAEQEREYNHLSTSLLHAQNFSNATKYSSYTLPGAKEGSYRELLLTMPVQTNKEPSFADYYRQKLRVLYGGDFETLSPADQASARRIYEQTKPAEQSFRRSDGTYKSSHFDEPNILAHIRFNERTDADGKRVLHIEEIQSDWHQEGRKKGYKGLSAEELAEKQRIDAKDSALTPAEIDWYNRVVNDRQDYGVPDAPFKKNWHELAFKRALRWAAENGYERMTWTTGEQQAERFDLSKHISSLGWWKTADDGLYGIIAEKDGSQVLKENGLTADKLEDYVGKEMAQKIVNGEGKSKWASDTYGPEEAGYLKGLDLKVGGEGMKGFYGQILPAFANKYAKKWGAKVGEARVQTAAESKGTPQMFDENAPQAYREANDLYAEDFPAKYETVHSIDITPAMRESVMQGQVLFQRGDLDTPFKAKPYEQTIRDAKVAFKTGKRGAAGTVWANEDGLVIIRAAIETAFPADEGEVQLDLQNFFNSNTDSANAQKIANVIKAEAADVDNSPDERRAYRQIARELQAAINSGDTVSIVYSGTFPHAPFNRARARRHELFHAAQQDLRNSPAFFNRNPLARKAGDALAAMNYPRSDWTIEAAAYVASGDHSRMGLTEDEGKQFLTDYFDDIVANNGRDALERFVLMAPKMAATLKEAKGRYGIQDQKQAGTDAAQAGASLSGTGNGAAFRASKSSGELPRATPERRRPQTGLLRGIDLEKVRQRQAGGGGAMPPRPPRPPREGGRREEQSGEPPKQSKLRRAWDQAGNALSLPRALMASLDLSAPLRQGAILTLPPSQWGRAMKATAQMIKSLNTKQFERFVGRLQSHPDRPLADEAGLHLSNKEEDFSSEWTQKIPLVKQSEQAYTSYLDSLRLDTFSRYNKAIEKAGLSADDAKAARKAAAEWINVATGRGSLGESFERAMPVLSKLLFSPRYTASRFQVLNPYTYAKNLRTPGGRIVARNQMADLVQFLGVTGATLALASMAGAEVDDDLQSSDFGKIRVGNTRYDIFAGLLQPLRMMYRVGRDLSGAAVGKESAKGENAMEIAGKFARSKLAPVPSYFVDAVTRKDFIGRDFDPKRGAVERVLPLMWRDFYEAVQREGSLGAAKMTPGFFGIGVQDYEKRPGALGLTGRSKFVEEMRNAGLDYKFAPPLKNEPASLHRARTEKIEQWLSTYGEKLVSHPRWGQLSAEEKKTAISNLRRRVSENANLKQPSTADFDAGRIIAGVRRAATEKPKSDRKKIYAEP